MPLWQYPAGQGHCRLLGAGEYMGMALCHQENRSHPRPNCPQPREQPPFSLSPRRVPYTPSTQPIPMLSPTAHASRPIPQPATRTWDPLLPAPPAPLCLVILAKIPVFLPQSPPRPRCASGWTPHGPQKSRLLPQSYGCAWQGSGSPVPRRAPTEITLTAAAGQRPTAAGQRPTAAARAPGGAAAASQWERARGRLFTPRGRGARAPRGQWGAGGRGGAGAARADRARAGEFRRALQTEARWSRAAPGAARHR